MSHKVIPQINTLSDGTLAPKHIPADADVYDLLKTNEEIKEHEMLTTRELFVLNLSDLMKLYGLTQTDLVDKTGMSKSTVSAYCLGKRFPRAEHLEKLASVFHVSPSFLIGEVDRGTTVSELPTEVRDVVTGMLRMSKDQRESLLRYCEYVYPEEFTFREYEGDPNET